MQNRRICEVDITNETPRVPQENTNLGFSCRSKDRTLPEAAIRPRCRGGTVKGESLSKSFQLSEGRHSCEQRSPEVGHLG